jgi:hypothetical protein
MGIRESVISTYSKLRRWFFHETWALPVDIFRVLAGFLSFSYFFSLLFEVNDFSSPHGLINHDFFLETFWWLKINLIQPGSGAALFYVLIGLACIGTFAIILGYRARLVAAILFVIASSIQRWNFAVMFVDDAIMHLLLFWLILLPVGKTLVLTEWIKEGNGCFTRWMHTKVPAIAVSCLIGNICWIYFFAGVTKLTSPLWREGFALYPILLLPISLMPDFWKPEHVPFLRFATYASLIMEIALPFFLLSPKDSLRKWVGLLLQVLFNLGIILTLKIPFANIAMLASAVLFFREELMEALLRRQNLTDELGQSGRIGMSTVAALVFVVLVILSTSRTVPVLKHLGQPATQALWAIGIIQNYYLFNWIDRLNYQVDQEAVFYPSPNSAPQYLDPRTILPRTVRHTLFQMRLYDIPWLMRFPKDRLDILKRDIGNRISTRACERVGENGRFVLTTTLRRVTPDNIELKKKTRTYKMSFTCSQNRAVNLRTRITR